MVTLSKLEARVLIAYHLKVIHAIKKKSKDDPEYMIGNEIYIAQHKQRIEELKQYA